MFQETSAVSSVYCFLSSLGRRRRRRRIMGCSQSSTKESSEKHVPADTLTEPSSYKGTSTTSVDKNKNNNNNNKKPTRPMVFAIMRNDMKSFEGA